MAKIETNIINDQQVEVILQGIVGIAELVFPDRIRSYYLTGSYAEDTAVSASDLDLLLVFKERITEDERNAIWDLSDNTSLLAPMFLDLEGVGEDQIAQKGVQLKLASHCICGEDIWSNVQLPPMDDYIREWMHDHPLHFMMRLAREQESILYPLDFPDPNDPFMGYGKNPIESKKDTKLLSAIVGQIATAIVIHKAHVYVPTKGDCLTLYREHIKDEWVDFIEQVYEVCRNQWEYQIPDEPGKQEKLQSICKRTLEFENYFLLVYQDYLLSELKKEDKAARLKAIKKSGEIIYPDQAIDATLENLKMSEDNSMRQAILASLTRIQTVKGASNSAEFEQ